MNKKLIVKQDEISDCGVCSLLSIIRYYGGNISLEELRISSLTDKEGVTALNLINCAIKYGFDAMGKKLDNIPFDQLPCIAHVRINDSLSHFMVIYSVKNDKVLVMDPSCGFRKISIDSFYSMSTGIYILLKPKGKIKYQLNPQLIKKEYKNSILTNKSLIFKIILINYIYLLISIIYSFNISVLMNSFNFVYIMLFFILLISSNFFIYLINNNINKFNNKIALALNKSFLNHIFNLPLNYIHIKDSNELIKRVLDLNSLKDMLGVFIINLITNASIIIITSIIIAYLRFEFLIMIIIFSVLFILISILTGKYSNDVDKVIDSNTTYNNRLIDCIEGLKSIIHTSSTTYFNNSLYNDYQNDINAKYKFDNKLLKVNFLKQSYILSTEFIINIYAIYLININQLLITDLFVINLLYQLIVNSLVLISNYIPSILYQRKIIIRVNELFNIKEEKSGKNTQIKNGDFYIKGLSFSYNNYDNVINNQNIRIRKGEKLIIKGESGCGKSTLCKLLNKEYDNYKGDIYIGNINYKELSSNDLRRIISYSSQNEKIFHGTIRDNILMGNEIDIKDFEKILYICEIERIISKKPFGLDTYLYGGGDELSGGERQLIILARSLVLNKPILILDESLSEVNDVVENIILKRLFSYYKDRTIIYVSHKNKKNYFHRTIYV